jgi:hypothetical protein
LSLKIVDRFFESTIILDLPTEGTIDLEFIIWAWPLGIIFGDSGSTGLLRDSLIRKFVERGNRLGSALVIVEKRMSNSSEFLIPLGNSFLRTSTLVTAILLTSHYAVVPKS